MSCSTCIKIDCLELNEFDTGQLTGGYNFASQEYQFVLNCPQGYTCLPGSMPRIITVPAGGTFGGGGVTVQVPQSWVTDKTGAPTIPDEPLPPGGSQQNPNPNPNAPQFQNPPYNPDNPNNNTPVAKATNAESNPTDKTRTIRLNCSTGCVGAAPYPLIATVPSKCTYAQLAAIVQGLMKSCALLKAQCTNLNTNPKPIRNAPLSGILFYTNPNSVYAKCQAPKVGLTGCNKDMGDRASCSSDVVEVGGGPPSDTQPSLLNPPNDYLYSPIAVVNGDNKSAAIADANFRAQQYANGKLQDLIDSGEVICGFLNTQQCATAQCQAWLGLPGTTKCVPKGYFKSTISQADADNQAKAEAMTQAAAELSCPKVAGNQLVCADSKCTDTFRNLSLQRCISAYTYVTTLNNPTYQQYLAAVQANNVLAINAVQPFVDAQAPAWCAMQPFNLVTFSVPGGAPNPPDPPHSGGTIGTSGQNNYASGNCYLNPLNIGSGAVAVGLKTALFMYTGPDVKVHCVINCNHTAGDGTSYASCAYNDGSGWTAVGQVNVNGGPGNVIQAFDVTILGTMIPKQIQFNFTIAASAVTTYDDDVIGSVNLYFS